MLIDSSENSAGMMICWPPSRIACCDGLALLEMPVDVLDRDGGIVHQDADRERQAAERHDVDGLADHRQHRIDVRTASGIDTRDDQRRAQAAEEQQDHQRRQRRSDDALARDAGNRGLDEDRLIADQTDVQPGRARRP